jgi:hypothetical protein
MTWMRHHPSCYRGVDSTACCTCALDAEDVAGHALAKTGGQPIRSNARDATAIRVLQERCLALTEALSAAVDGLLESHRAESTCAGMPEAGCCKRGDQYLDALTVLLEWKA